MRDNKARGQLSSPSLKTWCWSLCTTVTHTIKMQISSSHPSLSPSQFLSMNLHFKPGGLGGSRAGDLNLGFTGMLRQGPQTTVCRRVTGKWEECRPWNLKLTDSSSVCLEVGQRGWLHFYLAFQVSLMQVVLGLHCENCPGGLRGSLLCIPSFHSHFLTTYTQTFNVCVSVPLNKLIYLLCCSRS